MIPSKRILNSRKRQRSTRKPSKRTRKQRGGQAMTTSLGDLTTTSLGDTTTLGDPATTTTDTTVRALLESALTNTVTMDPIALNTAATMAENQYINATPEQRAQIDKISFVIQPFLSVASWKVIKPVIFDDLVDLTTINPKALLQFALYETVKMSNPEIGNMNNTANNQYNNATPEQKSRLETIKNILEPYIFGTKMEIIQNIMLEVPITPAQTT